MIETRKTDIPGRSIYEATLALLKTPNQISDDLLATSLYYHIRSNDASTEALELLLTAATGRTAVLIRGLEAALRNQNLSLAEELITLGADPQYHAEKLLKIAVDLEDPDGQPSNDSLRFLLEHGVTIASDGAHALCDAVRRKNYAAIQLFCDFSAEKTPILSIALRAAIDNGDSEAVDWLIQAGADPFNLDRELLERFKLLFNHPRRSRV